MLPDRQPFQKDQKGDRVSEPQTESRAGASTEAHPKAPSKNVVELSVLLDQVLAASPLSVVAQSIENTLLNNVEKIRTALPSYFNGEAERLVRRAIIYYQNADPKTKLHLATPQSFMMCVIKAAEIGLPLDGRLCHAVVFNNKKIVNKVETWVSEATCMPDYKGLIAVAKRTGTIADIFAEIVCEKDEFSFRRTEGVDKLDHTYSMTESRGAVIGCYGKVMLPSGAWRFEIMRRDDIDSIRGKSKAAAFGPWKEVESNDWREMAKKSVLKRMLKGFADDPGLMRALELDDESTGYSLESAGIVPSKSPGFTLPTDTVSEPAPPKSQSVTPPVQPLTAGNALDRFTERIRNAQDEDTLAGIDSDVHFQFDLGKLSHGDLETIQVALAERMRSLAKE
jgi:recombination protein RecT